MDLFGVGRFSCSSEVPPSDDLELLRMSLGEGGGLFMLAELDARRKVACCCRRGDSLSIKGDVGGCDVRRTRGGARRLLGVAGAEVCVSKVLGAFVVTDMCLMA